MSRLLARCRGALLVAGPVGAGEVVAMTALLTILAAITFGQHVLDGGFYSDDWGNAGMYERASSPRYPSAVRETAELLGSRPVLAVLLPAPYAVLGIHPAAHLGMALALGICTCLCFYLFLRVLPLARVHAGAIAGLALVFPWADSIRVWPTASLNTVALTLAFLGAYVALRAFERDGGAVALVGAGALYALSVLTYEVAGIALLLVGALYLLHAPREKALQWWAIHAAVVAGALAYTALTTAKSVGSLGERLGDIPMFARQAVALLSLSFVPPGTANQTTRAAALAVAAAVVVLGIRCYRRASDARLGFWLAFMAGSVVAIASAYAVTLRSGLEPMEPGMDNRGNVFAAFGFVALLYGLAMIASSMFGHRPRLTSAVAVGVVGSLMLGYVVRAENDAADWDRAARLQQPVIRSAATAAASRPRGSTLFTFGYPAEVSSGIPIFSWAWDLDGALAVTANDSSLHGYPIYDGAHVTCARRAVTVDYPHSDERAAASYRAAFFLDVPTGVIRRITSRAGCLQGMGTFRPGSRFPPS